MQIEQGNRLISCTAVAATFLLLVGCSLITESDPECLRPRGLGMDEFVIVSAGTFTMGSPSWETGRSSDETQHPVTLTHSFAMQATEVTQAQFAAVMGYQPSESWSCGGSGPVEHVSWHEAAAFCNAASAAEGFDACYTCSGSGSGVTCEQSTSYPTPYDCPGYRLPTEAEWEYAARAGTTTGTYNGTSTLTDCTMPNTVLDPIAWFCGEDRSDTHPVGHKVANAWGLYDMLGNVSEWCGDWDDEYPGTVTDPWGPAWGDERVLRGGSYRSDVSVLRAAFRTSYTPDSSGHDFGFRPVRTLP